MMMSKYLMGWRIDNNDKRRFTAVRIIIIIIILCLWNDLRFIECWSVEPSSISWQQQRTKYRNTNNSNSKRIPILDRYPLVSLLYQQHKQPSTSRNFRLFVDKSNTANGIRQQLKLLSKSTSSSLLLSSSKNNNRLEEILEKYGYKTNRYRILTKEQLPVVAEVYINGQSTLAYITSFVPIPKSSTTSTSSSIDEPKFVIETIVSSSSSDDPSTQQQQQQQQYTVDFGQITTIWEITNANNVVVRPINFDTRSEQLRQIQDKVTNQLPNIPNELLESILDRIYTNYADRARLSSKGINKKQISSILQKTFGKNDASSIIMNDTILQHADNVLRKIVKAGTSYCRVIDSTIVSEQYLYNTIAATATNNNDSKRKVTINVRSKSKQQQEQQYQQALAARIVSDDAKIGGRFKRWPCIFLSTTTTPPNTEGNSESDSYLEVDSITYINGGWLVVDRIIRATEEARKFTERIITTVSENPVGTSTDMDDTTKATKQSKKATLKVATRSDERIVRRLECLAMGEIFSQSTTSTNTTDDDNDATNNNKIVELDVRETLKQMELPISSDGAKEALIRIGHWSPNSKSQPGTTIPRFLPWSKQVLQAAAWYIDGDHNRSTTFNDYFNRNVNSVENILCENRVDMTNYPSICIDAERTAFRDDAFSIRYRCDNPKFRNNSNDRNSLEKSKYELLIHIADVSDIYIRNPPPGTIDLPHDQNEYLQTLRVAAESRGTSRYDLPFGPLHLLPPVILESLSFSNKKRYNRCITLWVYIDEETGHVLDAGFERSIIVSPTLLSYQAASDIMDTKYDKSVESSSTKTNQRLRALLLVAERILLKWSTDRQMQNVIAQKREARLASREVKYQNHGLAIDATNLPAASFRRSRGHRLVDSYLDLHSVVAFDLCQRNGSSLPQVIGADASRGGRIATAPLRRYIDGVAQTQILASFLKHGKLMTPTECRETGKIAAGALRSISNIRSTRNV